MLARRVLVIDDDPALREVIRLSLELTAGWSITTAASGPEGLQHAAALAPDVILLDMTMPGMSGREVLRRLRADAATAAVPVIFLTARAGAAEESAAADDVLDGLIAKPFDHRGLAAEVARLAGWPGGDVAAG